MGDVVDGRYELCSVIGAGGMGQVWAAQDRQLESPCAVKFILGHMAQDKHARGRFAREAKAVAALRTAHVVQVFGLGEHRGVPYIAMELLEGETLRGRLTRDNRLDANTTLAIVEQVVHALDRARAAQIVHRDLKPENIWLSAEREVFVKILDFGVAKAQLTTSSVQTVTGALLGTPYYMSPEQALGKSAVDYRSDLWALAIIAVECLSGKRPFESESLSELLINICTTTPPPLATLAPHLPPSLQAFWERGLAREPENRFQSGGELLEALRRCLADPAASLPAAAGRTAASTSRAAVSVSPIESTPVGRQSRNWPRHVIAGAIGVALTAGLAITAVRVLDGSESAPPRAAAPKGEAAAAAPTAQPAAEPEAEAAPSEPLAPAPSIKPIAEEPSIEPMAEEEVAETEAPNEDDARDDRDAPASGDSASSGSAPASGDAPSQAPLANPSRADQRAPQESTSKSTLAAELQALTGTPSKPPGKPATSTKPPAPKPAPAPPPEPAPSKSKDERRVLGI